MTDRLSLRGLARTFGDETGLFGVDLDVAPGQVHALVGLNGAGKTTLMRLALGMLRPSRGEVLVDGIPAGQARSRAWARVGHLVDHPFAYPELDTVTNLRIAARLHGVPSARVDRVVDEAITALGLERYARVKAERLSLGNRQRVGLAAALQHDPTLVVLDEPTNALDPGGVLLLREALRRRAADGAGVLVSSHHLDEVSRIADHITVLNRGRLIGTLKPGTVDPERAFFDLVHTDDLRSHA